MKKIFRRKHKKINFAAIRKIKTHQEISKRQNYKKQCKNILRDIFLITFVP
jgi:hypothetical protein